MLVNGWKPIKSKHSGFDSGLIRLTCRPVSCKKGNRPVFFVLFAFSFPGRNTSDKPFRHHKVVYETVPIFRRISHRTPFSGRRGTCYAPTVHGNVNEDFVVSNDLTYIYVPNDAAISLYIRKGIPSIPDHPMPGKARRKITN